MKKFIGYRTIKTAVGAAIAVYIAQTLGLSYAISAGVVTVLSVQNTKMKSIEMAVTRLGSTTLGLLVGALVFTIFGYSALSFGIFLIIFIPFAAKMNLQDGIVPSTVLVTHLWIENSIALSWMLNEYGLLIIGAGIALIFNIHMPNVEKEIREDQKKVEDLIKEVLRDLSEGIQTQSVNIGQEKLYKELESALKSGYERSQRLSSNNLKKSFAYYVKYMEMRIRQFEILKQMRSHLSRINKYYEQNRLVGALTELVAYQFDELNTGKELIEDLREYLDIFRSQKLPETREEFENRSSLYQYVTDLHVLLLIKKDFSDSLSEEEINTFWKTKTETGK